MARRWEVWGRQHRGPGLWIGFFGTSSSTLYSMIVARKQTTPGRIDCHYCRSSFPLDTQNGKAVGASASRVCWFSARMYVQILVPTKSAPATCPTVP